MPGAFSHGPCCWAIARRLAWLIEPIPRPWLAPRCAADPRPGCRASPRGGPARSSRSRRSRSARAGAHRGRAVRRRSGMGHELPAALGIRMHEGPDGEVFVIVGDGSLLMAPAELATAAQHKLKATIIVLDNAGYGSIDALAGDVSVGNRFTVATDFAALATSLGCGGVRAENPDELAR